MKTLYLVVPLVLLASCDKSTAAKGPTHSTPPSSAATSDPTSPSHPTTVTTSNKPVAPTPPVKQPQSTQTNPDPLFAGTTSGSKEMATPPKAGETKAASDSTISERVRLAILDDAMLAVDQPKINVVTKNGVVTLTGSVSSETNKQRVESLVSSSSGSGTRVENQLEVKAIDKPVSGDSSAENALAGRITTAIQNDSTLGADAGSITVTVSGGTVTLKGAVQSQTVKDRAEALVTSQTGVAQVDNQLEVKSSKVGSTDNASDSEISDRVKKAISDDPELTLEALNVRVNTSAGVVTLTGSVQTPHAKEHVGALAADQFGVVRVDNQLDVKEP